VRALEGVREALVVATCNRVELYAAGDDDRAVAARVRRQFFTARRARRHLYEHRGEDGGARHAFRVCASLDSLVVGEPQILGR
jgi:glutamyl-tRNA reductase